MTVLKYQGKEISGDEFHRLMPVDGGSITINGKRYGVLAAKFVFDLVTSDGLPLEMAMERMNEDQVFCNWPEVARLMHEHQELSRKHSKFRKEVF